MKLGKSARGVAMSDVALAAARMRELVSPAEPGEKVKVLLDRAYRSLSRAFPGSDWSPRRVRALWNREAARVDYREIAEIEALIAEARKRHAAYIEHTAEIRSFAEDLASRLERQDPDFHGRDIEGLRSVASGMDRAGDQAAPLTRRSRP